MGSSRASAARMARVRPGETWLGHLPSSSATLCRRTRMSAFLDSWLRVSSPSARVDGTGRRRKAQQFDDDRTAILIAPHSDAVDTDRRDETVRLTLTA